MAYNPSWWKAFSASLGIHCILGVLLAFIISHIVIESPIERNSIEVMIISTADVGRMPELSGGQTISLPSHVEQGATIAAAAEAVTRQESVNHSRVGTETMGVSNTNTRDGSEGNVTGTVGGNSDGEGLGAGSYDEGASSYGEGQNDGTIGGSEGTVGGFFDRDSFWAAINANKDYPYMAVKRGLEGTVTIACTILPSGVIESIDIVGSSGYDILDKAAVSAARSIGSFPNDTGDIVTVTTDVNFVLQ